MVVLNLIMAMNSIKLVVNLRLMSCTGKHF